MTCNPWIHAGTNWSGSCFDRPIINREDQVVMDCCLYPFEQVTVAPARGLANCLEEHPILGRVCALPIATGDTLCSVPGSCFDAIWSGLGTFVCCCGAAATCCLYKKGRRATKNFACATVQNVGGVFANIFPGPLKCVAGTLACYDNPDEHYTTFWKNFPCVLVCCPLSCGMGVYGICIDPEAAGKEMTNALNLRYPT